MNEIPFFSIILPTYNRCQMIGKAIESVMLQEEKSWELLVVDDGSTDNTKEIVESFGDKHIKYFYQENQERSAARNKGISNATGEYICFLDSDDYYLPEHLKSFHDYLSKSNNPIAFLYSKVFNDDDGILSLPDETINASSNTMEFVIGNTIGPPQVCIHSSILKKHKFNPLIKIGEDLDLWLRILNEFPLIAIESRTVVFNMHAGRTVNVMNRNTYKESLNSFRISMKNNEIRKKISPLIRRKYISNSYFGISKYYLYKRKRIIALAMIKISILYNPSYQLKYKINIIYNILFNYKKALELVK